MQINLVVVVIVAIQAIFLLAVIYLSIRTYLKRIKPNSLLEEARSDLPGEKYPTESVIYRLFTIIRANQSKGRSIDYDELSEIVYLDQTRHDSWIKTLINSEIILGLLGTFWGLVMALGHIEPSQIAHNETVSGFINALSGQNPTIFKRSRNCIYNKLVRHYRDDHW